MPKRRCNVFEKKMYSKSAFCNRVYYDKEIGLPPPPCVMKKLDLIKKKARFDNIQNTGLSAHMIK